MSNTRQPTLFPAIRLVSLQPGRRVETPFCPPDVFCPSHVPCVVNPSCSYNITPCTATARCACDCAGHCSCHGHCPCVTKGTTSPEERVPPEACATHARTFFRLAGEG